MILIVIGFYCVLIVLSMILHYRATEIAVSTLSPVAIIVRILHFYSSSITPVVSDLSLFSIISNPKKFRSHSTCSLEILITESESSSGSIFSHKAITLNPSFVYYSKTSSKLWGRVAKFESSFIFSGDPLTNTRYLLSNIFLQMTDIRCKAELKSNLLINELLYLIESSMSSIFG